jgi:hypothetical protein
LYINDVLSALDHDAIRSSVESSISLFRSHPEPKPAYTEYILNRPASTEEEAGEITQFWKVRLKLVELLQSGLHYDAAYGLERIEQRKDLLLAELVILYGRVWFSWNCSDSSYADMRRRCISSLTTSRTSRVQKHIATAAEHLNP